MSNWMDNKSREKIAEDRLRFDYWREAESVAMHFNDLLLNLRMKALGTLGLAFTFGAAASRLTELEHADAKMTIYVLATAFLICWVAVGLVDVFYYTRLLHGAVAEIRRQEKKVPTWLSTKIESHASKCHQWVALALFYGLPALGLAVVIYGNFQEWFVG